MVQGPVTGINCLLQVNTGTDQTPVYTTVAGQRDATLKMDGKEVDVTSKDSDGWEENIPGILSWSVDCSGLYIDGDDGSEALETAFMSRKQIMVQHLFPSGRKYSGLATITGLEIAAPQDKEMTNKISLKGSGPLTPTPAA